MAQEQLKRLYNKVDRQLEKLETDEYYMNESPEHNLEKEHLESLAKEIEKEILRTLRPGEKFYPRQGKQFYLN